MKLPVKKFLIIGLVLIIALTGFTGCKSKYKSTSKNNNDDIITTGEPTNAATKDSTDESDPTTEPTEAADQVEDEDESDGKTTSNFIHDGKPIDSAVFKDYSYPSIVFNRPMYQVIEEGYSTIFNRGDILFIAYSPLWEEHPDLKPNDVFSVIKEYFYDSAEMYDYGIYSQELTMDKTEEMTINGVDCLRFEGKLTVKSGENDTPRDLYSIGYTFVKANIPCMIIGVVVEDEQTDAHKEEVTHNVDEMMKTLRDEE